MLLHCRTWNCSLLLYQFINQNSFVTPHLLQITLGNPRQACRQFGICRIELWDGTPPGEQQCIARAEIKQAQLSLLFLADYLRPPLRQGHFDPCFLVEAPCRLPAFMALPGWVIMPGGYAVQVGEEGLSIYLKLIASKQNTASRTIIS